MTLATVNNGSLSVTSGGGEQTIIDEAHELGTYVMQFSIAALDPDEQLIYRMLAMVDGGVTPLLAQEVTLTQGVDPDVFTSPPLPSPYGDVKVTIEPVAWGANRNIAFTLFHL